MRCKLNDKIDSLSPAYDNNAPYKPYVTNLALYIYNYILYIIYIYNIVCLHCDTMLYTLYQCFYGLYGHAYDCFPRGFILILVSRNSIEENVIAL